MKKKGTEYQDELQFLDPRRMYPMSDQLHWEKHEDPNLGGDVSRPENLDVTPMPTNKLEPQETIGIL